jgi:hypothetical protein
LTQPPSGPPHAPPWSTGAATNGNDVESAGDGPLDPSRLAADDDDDGVSDTVPSALRLWFIVHFVVDLVFAVPLLLVPEELLPLLGWTAVDPVSARLVGAALMGIGVQSWRSRNAGVPAYRALLSLKIIWSASAIFGLTLAIARGAPPLTFALLSIFLIFCGVWTHHAIRLRQADAAVARREGGGAAPSNDPSDAPDDEAPSGQAG